MPPAKKSKRRRQEQTYQPRQNAVHITLYDQSGQTIDPRAQQEFEDAAWAICAKHKILFGVATS